MPTIKIKRLPHAAGLPLPAKATPHSACADLHAAVLSDLTIEPGKAILVPTGLMMEIPAGHEAQVRPRSGLALKHSIGLLNSPGTIDSDYRGEVCVILFNFGKEPFVIRRGNRIAQMALCKVESADFVETEDLEPTQRGAGGFGHTGIAAK